MRIVILILVLLTVLPIPVYASEYTVPTVPSDLEEFPAVDSASFTEDLLVIVTDAMDFIQPSIREGAATCISIIGISIMLSAFGNISSTPQKTIQFIGALMVGLVLFRSSNSMIELGRLTIEQISEYGRLLVPVLASALAAQGGTATSSSLLTGTTVLDAVLSTLISGVNTPLIFVYIALSVANSATGESLILKLRDFVKWLLVWLLKITLYVFTGYMTMTGVVSGSTDAATLKATKLTISGMVPVVGGILSDASEAILVSATMFKNAAGLYGMLAIMSMIAQPFVKIGVQYLLLKMTAAICEMVGPKSVSDLIKNFSTAMGLVLAMTGSVCVMLLVSVVCFMKGVA